MNIEEVKQAKTQEEVHQFAIEWSTMEFGEWGNVSWGEIAEWSKVFTELAVKFDLTEEFRENGII